MGWIVACMIGEAIGIAVVSMGYAAGDRFFPGAALLLVLAAGAFEGLSLGTLQALAGRRYGIERLPWIAATMLAALIGYGLSLWGQRLGGAATAADVASEPPFWLIAIAGAGIGLFMGLLFGAAQSFVAPQGVSKCGWILRNTLGWAPAMAGIMVAASIAGGDWPLVKVALLGLAAGAFAGLCVGASTQGGIKRRNV